MLNLFDVKPGQQVQLKNGAVCEVLENLGDGIWLQLRTLRHPTRPDSVGEEEPVHCEEMVRLVESTPT